MFSGSRWHLPLFLLAAAPAIAQQAAAPQPPAHQGAPMARSLTPDATPDTRAIMDLMMKIEAATVSGDAAFVAAHTSPDFTMVDGDHWANGGLAQVADDKAAYLKRVSSRFYFIRDLDPGSIHLEMHEDVAVVFGRYVGVTRARPDSKTPSTITSTWFERVFQKRNGEWVLLSHRTVHGPIPAPAGIDPTAIPLNATREQESSISPYPPGGPIESSNAGIPRDKDPSVSKSPEVPEILDFEHKQEAALVNGDVDFLQSTLADDFSFSHGDYWNRGGEAFFADDKGRYVARGGAKYYKEIDIGNGNEYVELHGNVAITYGRFLAYVGTVGAVGKDPNKAWYAIWFERVFEKQPDGKWKFLSHRTVHGPTYAPTRDTIEAVPLPYPTTGPWY